MATVLVGTYLDTVADMNRFTVLLHDTMFIPSIEEKGDNIGQPHTWWPRRLNLGLVVESMSLAPSSSSYSSVYMSRIERLAELTQFRTPLNRIITRPECSSW